MNQFISQTAAPKKKSDRFRLFAICPGGLDQVLKQEVLSLGANVLETYPGGVEFEGNLQTAYKACVALRSASRVLLLLKEEKNVFAEEDLYRAVKAVDWTKVFQPNCTFAIYFTETEKKGRNAPINVQFWALKAKDAVCDLFRERFNERPSVDRKDPDITLRLHLHDQILKIYLDLSGPSLHERGYRAEVGEAPMKENLAAGLLLLAGWDQKMKEDTPLYDPFCGSGTLVIEAALMATRTAPGLFRTRFGFFSWLGHDPELFEKVCEDLKAKRILDPAKIPMIIGSDQSLEAIRIAEHNVERAGMKAFVQFKRARFEETTPFAPKGLIVTNPPYGVRLEEVDALVPVYQAMGSTLKHQYGGWSAGVITSEKKLLHGIALKPSKKWSLHNGGLESLYCLFEMWPSKKSS